MSLLLCVVSCKQKETSQIGIKPSIDSVVAFPLHKVAVKKLVKFPAELLPFEHADIFAKVTAYVKTVRVDIGDRVIKGQVLATLEAPELSFNVSQSEADVQAARSKLIGSKDTYYRLENASRFEGTIAPNELERARSQMMADSAFLMATRARTGSASQMKDYLVIKAPFNGIVSQKHTDPGALVGNGTTHPMFVVENNSILRLRLPIPESYISADITGQQITFITDAQPDITYKASISRKSGVLNVNNRTEIWEFQYNNKEKALKSGMYVTAIVPLARQTPSFVVPSSSVATNLEKRFVIRIKDGKAEWVDVRIGLNLNDSLEIFGPLQEGDILLQRATDERKPGTPLFVKK